jgi:hypothetical protein
LVNYHLATGKQLFVRGVITKLDAGDHETDDKDLIKVLDGALGVTRIEPKKQSKQTKTPE